MNKIDEKFVNDLSILISDKIKSISLDNREPWFKSTALPQNIEGRLYNGLNSIYLSLDSEKHGYELPVYTTFKQAQDNNIRINKGEKSTNIIYYNFIIKDKNDNNIPLSFFNSLSKEEKREYKIQSYSKLYNVFNLSQTNIKDVNIDLYNNIKERISPITNKTQEISIKELDNLIKYQSWYTKIIEHGTLQAYYSQVQDHIKMPYKSLYLDSGMYYSTLLHEIAHSTGHIDRLNRFSSKLTKENYAKEELVAELTAAVSGLYFNIPKSIVDDNAAYIKYWLNAINEEPDFLQKNIRDVVKASNMIVEKISNEEAILRKLNDRVSDINIYKTNNHNMFIRCKIDGEQQFAKPLKNNEIELYNTGKLDVLSLVKLKFNDELNFDNGLELKSRLKI